MTRMVAGYPLATIAVAIPLAVWLNRRATGIGWINTEECGPG